MDARRRDGRLREAGVAVAQYVAGAALGAVGAFLLGWLVLLTVLHYANDVSGFDLGESPSSAVIWVLIAAPFAGLVSGVVFVARRRARRRTRGRPARGRPTRSSPAPRARPTGAEATRTVRMRSAPGPGTRPGPRPAGEVPGPAGGSPGPTRTRRPR